MNPKIAGKMNEIAYDEMAEVLETMANRYAKMPASRAGMVNAIRDFVFDNLDTRDAVLEGYAEVL